MLDRLFPAVIMALVCCPTMAESAGGELAASSWQLVNISSMDDSIYLPDDPAKIYARVTGRWEGVDGRRWQPGDRFLEIGIFRENRVQPRCGHNG